MNSRERVLAILNRQPIDRIPVDIWYTPEVHRTLVEHTGEEDVDAMHRALGLDKIVWLGAPYQGDLRPAEGDNETVTTWGARLKAVQAGDAMYAESLDQPLQGYDTPESLDDYPWWPDPDQFDYEAYARQARSVSGEFATIGPWVSFYEVYCGLRGLQQSMMDVLMFPELVDAILDRIEAIQTEMIRRCLEAARGHVDMVFVSDDMGSQSGLLVSLETWDRFFRDRMRRWCELIHGYDVRVFFHTDGAAEPLIPRLLEVGIDVLNPIQHRCPGMEMGPLKEKYGDRLIFHGGVENQAVLPFGSPDDVRREVRECLSTLGRGGGYVCCSCHNIQAGTPVENILAMIETVHTEGDRWL